MSSLLITGSTGFIGRRVIERLNPTRYEKVYCMSRCPRPGLSWLSNRNKFELICADILDPKSYRSYLPLTNTVVHLAAVTGKRTQKEYFAVNGEGTNILLEQCKQAGVRQFLHMSSIVVKYSNKSRYYYAQSKELAEFAVRQSGLPYTIVRPTIVIGPGSPTWRGLLRLAGMPIIPILGRGKTRIQPIYVDDLVNCVLSILDEDVFRNATIELGGPEQITFKNFLTTIHRLRYGKVPRTLHLPVAPLVFALSVFEKPLYSVLPMTAGQLCAFYNDGVICPNALFEYHKPQMKGIDEMVKLVLRDEQHTGI